MVITSYLFNVTFTRADEGHAHVYEVGTHQPGASVEEAERRLRAAFAHLAVAQVILFAVETEDGDVIPADAYAASWAPRCGRCAQLRGHQGPCVGFTTVPGDDDPTDHIGRAERALGVQ